MQKILVFMGLGLEIGLAIVAAYHIGNLLDQKYQSKGLIFVILAFLLLIGWMIQVIWLVRRLQKDEDNDQGSV